MIYHQAEWSGDLRINTTNRARAKSTMPANSVCSVASLATSKCRVRSRPLQRLQGASHHAGAITPGCHHRCLDLVYAGEPGWILIGLLDEEKGWRFQETTTADDEHATWQAGRLQHWEQGRASCEMAGRA